MRVQHRRRLFFFVEHLVFGTLGSDQHLLAAAKVNHILPGQKTLSLLLLDNQAE